VCQFGLSFSATAQIFDAISGCKGRSLEIHGPAAENVRLLNPLPLAGAQAANRQNGQANYAYQF